jgi:FkbH-like protein
LPQDAPVFRVSLACGFTPLHLESFLAAALRERSPAERVQITTGLFGDLAGNIEGILPASCDALVAVIEWQDLDLRLGIRNLGGWRVADLPDIVKSTQRVLGRLEKAIRTAATSIPVYVSLPTLPLPPLFTTANQQASAYELELRQALAAFGALLATHPRIRVLSASHLDEISSLAARFDIQSELSAGFPYRLPHASALAQQFAALMRNPAPKKGLITDLDDTLWSGILGESGVEGVCWNLDHNAQIHGVYQQFLASLASAGVLIAIASKNEPALVQQAFEREDLLIGKQSFYPIDVHWGPKSESVRRTLTTWNIAADSVVFVDDSPMELAEVKAAFPKIECLVFPKNDYQAFWQLLRHLRDSFGKAIVSEEDSIRLDSIRSSAAMQNSSNSDPTSLDSFLQEAKANVVITLGREMEDRRAFELINKTNQFNLNGRRVSESSWMAYFQDPANFLMTVSYDDKYGPLGKIAVLLGRMHNSVATIDHWVMSCRAFSRRIEHQCLNWLFENFDLQEIAFDYKPTQRNKPIQDFIGAMTTPSPEGYVRVSRASFSEKCPLLFHQAKAAVNA